MCLIIRYSIARVSTEGLATRETTTPAEWEGEWTTSGPEASYNTTTFVSILLVLNTI